MFTITNTGTANLLVQSVTESGTGFSVAADTCLASAIAPSSNCTISVTFNPSADTSYSGNVTVTDNAGSSLLIRVSGQAEG